MLSLIEVQCPHCGARGQIMVPPVGAIIIGPCPQCNELVVVFCGHVLPLDKDTMENGTTEDRRDHLLMVLTDFLQERIAKLLSDDVEFEETEFGDTASLEAGSYAEPSDVPEVAEPEANLITETELERFTDVDLKLLDNKAYFKSVFEAN